MTTIPPVTALLLSSAAVGALVSSIITLVGQRIERKSRRREMLLSEAVHLAIAYKESLIKITEMTQTNRFIPDHAKMVQTYFVALSELLDSGKLPKGLYVNDPPEDRAEFHRKHDSY